MDGVDDGVGGGVVVHVGGVDDVVAVWCVFKRQQRVLLHKNDRQCRGLRKVVEARRKVRLPKVPYREEKDCYLHNEGRFFYPSDKDCKVNLKAPALANKINHEGSEEGGDPQEVGFPAHAGMGHASSCGAC